MNKINYYDYRKWHRSVMRNLAPLLHLSTFKTPNFIKIAFYLLLVVKTTY